jgi:pilus assembly protein CpaE
MSNVLRVAIVDPNDSTRERMKNVLLGMDSIWLEAECSRYEFFVDVVAQTTPEIGIISLDADAPKALALLTDTLARAPGCTLLVTSSSTDGRLILESMRAGAKEFLTQPLKPEDVSAALQRVRRLTGGTPAAARTAGCRTFCVTGAAGGVGATSVAVNLAVALAHDPENSVVMLDLDLALGDADVFLDTIPEYTLADVAENIERLDLTLLKRSLTRHASGLHLLPRPIQLEDARMISVQKIERVIGLLKTSFSHIVIDASKYFSEIDIAAMRQADTVLMVTQLDVPCLRNVVRLMASLDEDKAVREKVKVVVNRIGQDGGQIGLKKAQETLGRDVFWQIPNDFRAMAEARNNGLPLSEQAPKAAITQSILQLAAALSGKAAEDQEAAGRDGKGRRWLGLWQARSN